MSSSRGPPFSIERSQNNASCKGEQANWSDVYLRQPDGDDVKGSSAIVVSDPIFTPHPFSETSIGQKKDVDAQPKAGHDELELL
jgi:hypothetical protein